MANLNQVTLIGRLAEQPRLPSQGISAGASIRVVVNEYVREQGKKPTRRTDSFRVRLHGQVASYAMNHLGQGDLVMVSGRLRTEKWKDKASGETRYSVVVLTDAPEGLQRLATPSADQAADERDAEGLRPARSEGTVAAAPQEQFGIQPVPF